MPAPIATAPKTSRPLKKDLFAPTFKPLKPVLFSESAGRPSSLAPNIRSLSWSPTGSQIATAISSYVRIWNPDRPNVKSTSELRSGGTGMVEKVAFMPTHESVLASTGGDGMVRLWDCRVGGTVAGGGGVGVGPTVGKGVKGNQVAEGRVGDTGLFLCWRPQGDVLVVGRKDDVVQAVDVRQLNGEGLLNTGAGWELSAHEKTPAKDKGQFNAMAFSNSGRELFATTGEGPVKILDWPSLDLLHTLTAHTSATYAVQHSPAGTYVSVGGSDSLVTLWDTTHWHCAHALTAHSGSVRDLGFSFDGAYIAASSGSDARDSGAGIEISHADTGEVVHTVETSNSVTWLAWHPLRYWLAYAGDPGGLKILGAGSAV